MNGLKLLFWGLAYDAYNWLVNPYRVWELECDFCGETVEARSYNGALLRNSLHVHFSDDHPDGPEDIDVPRSEGGNEPEMTFGRDD